MNRRAALVASGIVLVGLGVVVPAEVNASPVPAGSWTTTGPMTAAHGDAPLVTLRDGRPFAVAGSTHTNVSEIYDESTGTWTAGGPINQDRDQANAVVLDNGDVLIAGGNDVNGNVLNTAELYDPTTGAWSYTGSLNTGRTASILIKLNDGRALIISGGTNAHEASTTSCELYDPATGQWTPTGSVANPVFDGLAEDAVVLNDGRVLLVGNVTFGSSSIAELYDPATGTWSTTGNLLVNRFDTKLVKLQDGRVLMIGGDQWGNTTADTEIYDPATGVWTSTGALNVSRTGHDAVLLPDGRVMVAGGITITNNTITATALPDEIYDPATGVWTVDATPSTDHVNGNLAMLPDGKILLTGGYTYVNGGPTVDSELFTATVPSQVTALTPAQVWIGLKNSDDVGLRLDFQAVASANGTPIRTGVLDGISGGSSGFNNAHLATIPFAAFTPVAFPPGSTLSITVSVRNTCSGPSHNSGTARLWYNDTAANSQFGATINGSSNNYFLTTSSALETIVGAGPKQTSDVAAGSKCSPFKPFGTWNITP